MPVRRHSPLQVAILELVRQNLHAPAVKCAKRNRLRDAPIEPIYGDGDDVDAPPELHASSRRWEPNRLTVHRRLVVVFDEIAAL